LNSFPSARFLS